MLGVLGGFSELIATYITTKIRCYNRVSIFIAFFSLTALALLVSRGQRGAQAGPAPQPGRIRWDWLLALWAVTAVGLLDQVPRIFTPDHARDAAAFRSDQEFVARIEKELPPGSMIFQLPQVAFPEFGRVVNMYDYSHFRGYLHSRQLRWSYGTLRGREGALHLDLSVLGPFELVDALVAAGFSGVYVDRKGHEADGQQLVRGLLLRVPQKPIISRDGSLLFFRLPVAPNPRPSK